LTEIKNKSTGPAEKIGMIVGRNIDQHLLKGIVTLSLAAVALGFFPKSLKQEQNATAKTPSARINQIKPCPEATDGHQQIKLLGNRALEIMRIKKHRARRAIRNDKKRPEKDKKICQLLPFEHEDYIVILRRPSAKGPL